jgi:hypothetical protein
MWNLCRLTWWALGDLFRPRAKLEAEILVLRQQINVLRRTAPKRLLLRRHRPTDICQRFSAVPRGSRRTDDRQAGHRDPLAPGRVQGVLAVEIDNALGTAKGGASGTPVDP